MAWKDILKIPQISKKCITLLFAAIGFALIVLLEKTANYNIKEISNHEWLQDAFLTGHCLSFLGGILVTKYSGRTIFGIALVANGFLSVFMSFLDKNVGIMLIFIVDYLHGIIRAFTTCAIIDIWSKWTASGDTSTVVASTFASASIASLIAYHIIFYLPKILCGTLTFYTGCLGILWAIVWLFFIEDVPNNDGADLPWKQILRCVPFRALCVASFIFHYGSSSIHKPWIPDEDAITHFHTYHFLFLILAGLMANLLTGKCKISATKVRKFFICVSFVVESMVTIIAYEAVIEFKIFIFFRSFAEIALRVNAIDLSPKYAGFLCGVQTLCGTIGGWMGMKLIKYAEYVRDGKIKIFCYMSFFLAYIAGAIIYYVWGSGSPLPCNKPTAVICESKKPEKVICNCCCVCKCSNSINQSTNV